MANEVNANINIDIDTTAASAGLKALQSQISSFNKSIVASNASATAAQRDMLSTLTSQIGSTKAFSTSMVSVESSVSRLGSAIDKNKLSMGEYFRYGVASSKNFGKVFSKEHNEIMGLAQDRVKRLQTQYIAMGQAQNGVTKAMAVRPLNLFNADAAVSIQRQQLFNKLLGDGSTSLINFGKNTQWAGRQLMVGFTVPLTIFGSVAGKIFMELERQVVNFRRVYGDAMTPAGETDQMVKEIQNLGKEFTKYGIAVKDTVGLAADVAAAGAQGDDLVAATAQSTRLATLGMIEMNQAMTATMALQTAFKLSNEELAQSVDFLNAVENQTVLSLDDVTVAIPKVAPIIKGLGGDVQDLAIFLTAMREGGVNAAEGANALKSGLASLINPTKGARDQLEKVGISIDSILSRNKGDIRGIVTEFGSALGELEKFERQQTLAKVFGKYQFARLGALFENISTQGSQAQRVVDLTGQSFEQLNELAEKELSAIEESIGMKFTGSIERAKLALAPIGEVFLKVATPIIEFATKLLEKFNELSPNIKQFATILVAGLGVVVPVVIMLIGLFANFAGNALKGAALMNNFFNKLRGGGSALDYLSNQELEAAAAASSLEGKTTSLTAALNVQRSAVAGLARAYGNYVASANSAATNLPQGVRGAKPIGMATGGLVPGKGNKDTVPAMLTPGESVITKEATEKYAPILQAMNEGILPGFVKGVIDVGGRGVSLDVASVTSGAAIQERVNRALENQVATAEQILAIFEKVKNDAKVSATSLSKISETVFPAPKESSKHSARAAGITGSVQSQLLESGKEQEYLRALDARVGVEKGVNQYYDQQISLARQGSASEEQIKKLEEQRVSHLKSMTQIDRAHIAELTVAQKKSVDAWSPDLWVAQTQAENQLSTILTSRQQNGVEQNKNTQLYLAELRKSDASQETIESITSKVTRGLALTEQELQVQAKVLKKMLVSAETMASTTPKFGAYASGVVGAAEARASSSNAPYVRDVATAQAKATAIKTMDSMEDQLLINSPSEAAAQIGDNIDEGVAAGIKRSASKPVAAAANMAKEVLKETDKAVAKANRSAGRLAGPAGMSTQELEAQAKAQARAERKLKGPVVRAGTLSPISFRAGEETTRIQNIGDAQSQAMQEQVNRAHREALSENTKVINKSSQEIKKQPAALKKFGGALKNGSMKMQGAFFAMDGMVFAASMMNNSMGEFAQKIMPAVFAIQGLTMMLPLLANPIVLAAAAVAAVGVGFWYLEQQRKAAQEKLVNMSIAVDGSAKAFDELSKELGGIKPSERFASLLSGVRTEEQKQALTEGQQFLETESGKSMVSRAKLVGGAERKESIEKELTQSLALGIITPEMAKGIAQALAISFKDPVLGQTLVASISNYMSKNSGDVTKSLNSMIGVVGENISDVITKYEGAVGLQEELNLLQARYSLTNAESLPAAEKYDYDEEGNITAIETVIALTEKEIARMEELRGMDLTNLHQDIAVSMGPLINAAIKLAEAQSLINLEYRSGTIDLEQFNEATEKIQSKQKDIQDVMKEIRSDKSGNVFREYFDLAAISLGITEEELGNINSTADRLASVLEKSGFAASDLAGDLVRVSMAAGELDTATAANIPQLLETKEFDKVINVAIEQDDPTVFASIIKGLSQIDMFPDVTKKTIMASFKGDWKDPDAVNRWLQETLINYSYFVDNPTLNLQVAAKLNEDPPGFTTAMAKKLEDFYSKAEKEVGVNLDVRGIDDVESAYSFFIKIKKEKDLKKVLDITGNWKSAFEQFGITYNQFAKLPDVTKSIIMQYITVFETRGKNIALAKNTSVTSRDAEDRRKAAQFARESQANQDALIGNVQGIVGDTGTDTGNLNEEDGSGGGSDTKSWLESLIAETESNLKLFPKMIDKIKNKFPGIPQQIIEMIGGGEEGIKRAQELLGASKQKIKKLIADYRKSSISQALQSMEDRNLEKKRGVRAESILTQQGFDPEDAKSLASNSEDAFAIIQASLTMTKKKFKEFLKPYREYIELTKEAESPNDKLKDQIDALGDSFKKAVKPIDDQIESQQELIESINEEIDAIERLNDADELSIRTKQREVEMLDRSIEAKERLNDADQRTIDGLSREDELRNRVADSLSKELDAMSKQEGEIRKSYDERIEALDKVASINDHIVDQQKQQIGLSEALSSGDIYAAAAAAQEMRASSAQFSSQQVRKSLQEGMENQIAGLKTSGGLTREQAEAQIESIKQQSYQTSLLIQGVEDKIFARNLEIRTIKDDIQKKNDEIRIIEDAIYDRETLILDIQNKRLAPAQSQLNNLTDQKEEMQKILEREVDRIEALIDENNLLTEQKGRVESLEAAWYKVAVQIKKAMDLAAGQKVKLGDMPERTAKESDSAYRSRLDFWRSELARIESEKDTSIAAAKSNVSNMFAGGKVMKYASGGVIGEGSRDSISAMLSPGEFVVRKAMVDKYGMPMLSSINQGAFSMPNYATPQSAEMGNLESESNTSTNVLAPMYNNYSVSVNVSNSNANPDDIANKVMFKMKQLQGQNIRSNRGY